MSDHSTPGIPPKSVTTLLRSEGLAVLIAAVIGYQLLGGNWWLFALLLLAPDLAMFGLLLGDKAGARIYNIVHTLTVPMVLAAIGWLTGVSWLLPLALIWIAHIGMDRAVGYGLKYPDNIRATHLGVMGKDKAKASAVADAS